MGWRENEPAKGTWFVPGGHHRKDEKIADAFDRIIRTGQDLLTEVSPKAGSAAYTSISIRQTASRMPVSGRTIACSPSIVRLNPSGLVS